MVGMSGFALRRLRWVTAAALVFGLALTGCPGDDGDGGTGGSDTVGSPDADAGGGPTDEGNTTAGDEGTTGGEDAGPGDVAKDTHTAEDVAGETTGTGDIEDTTTDDIEDAATDATTGEDTIDAATDDALDAIDDAVDDTTGTDSAEIADTSDGGGGDEGPEVVDAGDTGGDTAVPPTETELDCTDELDDDDDGLFDCEDPDCTLTPECSPTCSAVATVTCESTTPSGTNLEGATNAFAEYPCNDGFYTGPEIAYSFTVEEPTFVLVELQAKEDQTDLMIVEGAAGGCFAQQCIATDIKDLLFVAQPQTTYYFVVDGLDGAIGGFDLALTCEVCTPSCASKACGDNGCGGSCGACGAGEQCSPDQSACVAPPPGDTCADAVGVDSLPFTDVGSTTDAFDSYPALGNLCQDAGLSGGPDVVYTLTASASEEVRITLSDVDFDATLYVVTDCAEPVASCVGGADSLDEISLDVALLAGTTYYIVVDGTDELEAGAYTLTLESLGVCVPECAAADCGLDDGCGGSCPCAAANDVCAAATPITEASLPITLSGSTALANDDYEVLSGVCPDAPSYSFGQDGPDVVYSITPTVTGPFSFALPLGSGADFDASLYVVTDCAAIATSCVSGSEFIGLGGEELNVVLEGGTTYFVIVDGYKDDQGVFELVVDKCIPACDGKDCGDDGCGSTCGSCGPAEFCGFGQCTGTPTNEACATAATIDTVPFTAVGTTSGLTDDFSISGDACDGALFYSTGEDNGDVAWTFVPPLSATYTLRVESEEGWDPTLTVLTNCADAENTCIAAEFAGENLNVSADAGTPLTLVIDGDYIDDEGVFEFSICPECADNEYCSKGECVAPAGCDGVSFEGCCDGQLLKFCDSGELVEVNCGFQGCGWDTVDEWYACSADGEDPSGANPIQCPVAP